MNDQVAKKMLEYIDGSKDFLLETAPDFFREVAAYGVWYNGIVVVLKIVICVVCWKCVKKLTDNAKKAIDENEDHIATGLVFAIIAFGVIGLCAFADIFSSVKEFTMALFAPKLYIFSQLKG